MRFIQDFDISNKKVLLRLDLNVPLNSQGEIVDEFRIFQSLPTIELLLKQNAAIVILSHLGRPKGKTVPEFSLKPVANRLSELLKQDVLFVEDCVGPQVQQLKSELRPGQILLLENVRFYQQETSQEHQQFAKELAQGMDVFINDAFGCSHRSHASVATVAQYFKPECRGAGLLVQTELKVFQQHLLTAPKPITAIIGGSKISSKIGVLKSLIPKVKCLIIGGAMANTFLASQGHSMGKSLVESDFLNEAASIIQNCKDYKIELILPVDLIIADRLSEDCQAQILSLGEPFPADWMAVDIGPKTIDLIDHHLKESQVIFWNGPLGVYELDPFANGTRQVALSIAKIDAVKIVGGGDSAAAIESLGLKEKFDHVSTGGGASLELLEKGTLPAIEALKS